MAAPRAFVRLQPLTTPSPTRCHLIAGCSSLRTQCLAIPIRKPTIYTLQLRWQSGQTGGPAAGGANDYQFGPANDVQPQPSTQHLGSEKERRSNAREEATGKEGPAGGEKGGGGSNGTHGGHSGTAWKMFESAATTAASLSILGYVPCTWHSAGYLQGIEALSINGM
jgi:hypothetical protein